MHTELEPTQVTQLLRELPDDAARPYDWHEYQRRAQAAPAAAARIAHLRAFAAVIVIALAALATAIRFGASPHPAHPPAAAVVPDRAAPSAGGDVSQAAARENTAAQYWLERLPREPALVHVGTRAAVETLEDHIAQVDDLLSAERAGSAPAERLQVLQRERVQLVNSLVQVRYAETLADAAR
jgi:hypothetical protein